MLLPIPPSEESPLSPLLEGARQRKAVDKALVEKATTIKIVEHLPDVIQNALDLALTSDSDSVRLDATKYLLDRVAGKAVDRVQSVNVNVDASLAEVEKRLSHLNGFSYEEGAGF